MTSDRECYPPVPVTPGRKDDDESLDNSRQTQLNDFHVHTIMKELVEENQRMQIEMATIEAQYDAERKQMEEEKIVYHALKQRVQEAREHHREKKRLRELVEGIPTSPRTTKRLEKNLKKDRERLQQYHTELSLRYQLLESENKRYEMKIDQELANLRQQYSESMLNGFPNF